MVRPRSLTGEKIRIKNKQTLPADIFRGMMAARARVQAKFGVDNLGPYSDFEWGMINGKLSTLRWVLGDEWDFLDT
jgi:hypothetical protein